MLERSECVTESVIESPPLTCIKPSVLQGQELDTFRVQLSLRPYANRFLDAILGIFNEANFRLNSNLKTSYLRSRYRVTQWLRRSLTLRLVSKTSH